MDGYVDAALTLAYHTIAATAGDNGTIDLAGDVAMETGAMFCIIKTK